MPTGLPAFLSDSNQEWVLDFSNFRSAWSKTKGAGITIAHPDTGWTRHPELDTPNYRTTEDVSRNFYEPIKNRGLFRDLTRAGVVVKWSAQDNLRGWSSHGTGTAGVIVSPPGRKAIGVPWQNASFPENSPDAFVSGAAPDATVIPFRVTKNVVLMDDADSALASCIYFCIGLRSKLGIDVGVMSVSLSGTRFSTEHRIMTALMEARHAGMVVIAAAGQLPIPDPFHAEDDIGDPQFPASSRDTISAAACDSQHRALGRAFYGEAVDITAPGVNVWVPRAQAAEDNEEDPVYTVWQSEGTSYATALTAAACALWQSHHGRDSLIARYGRERIFTAFKYCLTHSADVRPGWDSPFNPLAGKRGAGVLDVEALLELPLPSAQLIEVLDTI